MISLQDILSIAADMLKLEKLVIGGIQGQAFTQQVQLLYQEFLDTYKSFTEKNYDCLDIRNMVCVFGRIMLGFVYLLRKWGVIFLRNFEVE